MKKGSIFSPSDFDVILFDFDGVLAESMDVKTEAFRTMYEPYGKDIADKVVKHHIENGGVSRFKKIKLYHSEYLNKELSEKELYDLCKEFSELVVEKVIKSPWVKGAKEFLDKYYKKIDFYVVSGTPEEEMELIIKKRKMEKYFKGTYGSPRTKSEIINQVIKEKKYDKKKALYIGDSLSDCSEAKKANVNFLGRITVNSITSFPEDTKVFNDFTELIYR